MRMGVIAWTLLGAALLASPLFAFAQTVNGVKSVIPAIDEMEKISEEADTGTVKSIDLEKRKIVIQFPDGPAVETDVSPEIENLQEVQPGDEVNIKYTEWARITVEKRDTEHLGHTEKNEKTVAPKSAGKPETSDTVISETVGIVQHIDTANRRLTVDVGDNRHEVLFVPAGTDLETITIGDKIKQISV